MEVSNIPTPAVDEQAILSCLSSFDFSASQNYGNLGQEHGYLKSPEFLVGRFPKEGFYSFTARTLDE